MEFVLSSADFRLAERHAELCALGGGSRIRGAVERAALLYDDQLVGQLGTIALHRYWFGDLTRYVTGRYFQNLHQWTGDNGEDIPAANVDVKTSPMRRSQDPASYRLLVRPRERHAGWVYVLALLPVEFRQTRAVHLVGWAADAELPATPEGAGPFDGAFSLPATALHPLPPIAYHFTPAA